MKKIVPFAIAILTVLLFLKLYRFIPLASVMDDGYAVTVDLRVGLDEKSEKEPEAKVSLYPIHYDDTMYRRGSGYYVGEEKQKLEMSYPLYVMDGGGLRFLSGQFYTVSSEFEYLQTYDGLYLVDGYTYNADRSQADAEEIYFVTLPNGMFINSLPMTVKTNVETYEIDGDSILYLEDNAIQYYSYTSGMLVYEKVPGTTQAVVTIGGDTYDYLELLRLLGLLRERIQANPEKPGTAEEETIEVPEEETGDTEQRQKKASSMRNSQQDTVILSAEQRRENPAAQDSTGNRKENGGLGDEQGDGLGDGFGSGGGGEDGSGGDHSGGSGSETGSNNAGTGGNGDDNVPIASPPEAEEPLERYVKIKKINSKREPLEGAVFSLYKKTGEKPDTEKDILVKTDLTTDANGEIWIRELENGAWYLRESEAPEGYQCRTNNFSFLMSDAAPSVELTIKNYTDEEIEAAPPSGPGGDDSGITDPSGPTDPPQQVYKMPGVKLGNWTAWTYAANTKIQIQDPEGYITKGVRFTVYKKQDNGTFTPVLRQVVYEDGSLTLSQLPPDTDLYIEGSFRYYTESATRENYVFLDREDGRIHTLPIQGNVAPLAVSAGGTWEIYPNQVMIPGVSVSNSTDYREGDDSFENFKKNTLPYAVRAILKVSRNGTDYEEAGRVTGIRLQQLLGGGVEDILSDEKTKLKSMTSYQVKLEFYDKENNLLPTLPETLVWDTRTCKERPSAAVSLTANRTGRVVLGVTAKDPDEAITTEGKKVYLQAIYNEASVGLSGTVDGVPFYNLEKVPIDVGSKQEVVITNLLFSKRYQYQVVTDCNLQDGKGEKADVVIGSGSITTAPIATGNITFNASSSNITGTGADIALKVIDPTSQSALGLITDFEIRVQPNQRDPFTTELTMNELVEKTEYVEELGGIPIREGNGAAGIPSIVLEGAKEDLEGKNAWQALTERLGSIRLSYEDGTLPQSTRHTIFVRSLIRQSGEEYEITTSVEHNSFSTLKRTPSVEYEDLLLVNDFAEFFGFQIIDQDDTIINGNVTLRLKTKDTNTLVGVKTLNASDPPQEFRFDYLIPDMDYVLEITADEYNVGSTLSTYQKNMVFKTLEFKGGSRLKGKLSLAALSRGDSSEGTVIENTQIFDYSLNTANGEPVSGSGMVSSDYTEYDPNSTYVFENAADYTKRTNGILCFYDSDRKFIKSVDNLYTRKNFTVSPVLDNQVSGAVWFRYAFPMEKKERAFVRKYDTPSENLITEEMVDQSYQYGYDTDNTKQPFNTTGYIPVVPGGYYLRRNKADAGTQAYVSFYSKDKNYLSSTAYMYQEDVIRVPAECGFVVISYTCGQGSQLGLYQLGERMAGTSFAARVEVYMEDGGSYLAAVPSYTLRLARSDSYRHLNYQVDRDDLVSGFSGEGEPVKIMEKVHEITGLREDAGYRLDLVVSFRNYNLTLDTLSFQTDDIFDLIETEGDLLKIRQNPGGNYLVTKDLTLTSNWYLNLTGTIDFGGHTVKATSGTLFNRIFDTGRVENLHLDLAVNNNQTNGFQLAGTNNGKIKNLIAEFSGSTVTRGSLIKDNTVGASIENFAILIENDFHVSRNSSILVYGNAGEISTGYYYVAPGGKCTIGQPVTVESNDYSAMLVQNNGSTGIIRDFYGVGNVYIDSKTAASTRVMCRGNYGKIENFYIRGDQYLVSAESTTRSGSLRIGSGVMNNGYYISEYTYANTGSMKPALFSNLLDAAWHEQILGEGDFETSASVSYGFYPRINFPMSMQAKQPYIPLPITLSGTDLRILDARMTGQSFDPDWTEVTLTLENPRNYTITGAEAENVSCMVLGQEQSGQSTLVRLQLYNPMVFVSSYKLTRLVYTNGSAQLAQSVSYALPAEFYKPISTVEEWSAIQSSPGWNYRLTDDIDFGNTSLVGFIRVDKNFTGKLDGRKYRNGQPTEEMYALKNITMTVKDPYVFSSVNGGEIKNLLVDNMTLIGSSGTSAAGLCRTAAGNGRNAQFDNVHVRNSYIEGAGYIGGLVGSTTSGAKLVNCSVADTHIGDSNGSVKALSLGGLVGYSIYTDMENCYVRGISIRSAYSQTVEGVGGLVGHVGYGGSYDTHIYHSYAEGIIDSTLDNVGGLVGYQGSVEKRGGGSIRDCWSQVSITTKGSVTGGITGKFNAGSVNTVLTLGSINSAGTDTYRIAANPDGNEFYTRAYAYEGQLFNGEAADRMDATSLISQEEVVKPSYWQDEMNFSSHFQYDGLPDQILPKVYSTHGGLVYGQTDIYIQGLGYDVTLLSAVYDGSEYITVFQVGHEHAVTSDMEFKVVIDGIGAEAYDNYERKNLIPSPVVGDEHKTILTIKSDRFTKAFDAYNATVSVRQKGGGWQNYGLSVTYYMDQAQRSPYYTFWEVPDINTWNTLMEQHSYTQENYRITGTIDIGGNPKYVGLRLGRLEGTDKASAGFKKIRQTVADEAGLVWIEMASRVRNLTFTDFLLYFSKEQTSARNNTGLLSSVFDVEDVEISNGKIVGNTGANTNLGFFGRVSGNIACVSINGVKIQAMNTSLESELSYSNVGLLCGYLEGILEDCTVTGEVGGTPTINIPRGTNVGGIVGQQNGVYAEIGERTNKNLSVKNVTISGGSCVGGVIGCCYARNGKRVESCTAENVKITLYGSYGGGIVGGMGYGSIRDCKASEISIEKDDIQLAAECAGGILGGAYTSGAGNLQTCTAKGITIKVTRYAGGIVGCFDRGNADGCAVEDAVIEVITTGIDSDPRGRYAGGIVGSIGNVNSCSVRNSRIKGDSYIGGIAGVTTVWYDGRTTISSCFVDDDVKVEGRTSIGGVAGQGSVLSVTGTACGADVTGTGERVGGFIGTQVMGKVEINNVMTFTEDYYVGNVKASSYAGGMIGVVVASTSVSNPNIIMNPNKIQKILIAGSITITNPGGQISPWANGLSAASDIGSVGYFRAMYDLKLIYGEGEDASVYTGDDLADYFPKKFSDAELAVNMRPCLVYAADMGSTPFYSGKDYAAGDMGFTDAKWDYSGLASSTGKVMPMVVGVNNGNGIPVPDGAAKQAMAMLMMEEFEFCRPYPSGVNTINLELIDYVPEGEGWELTVCAGGTAAEDGLNPAGEGILQTVPVTGRTFTMEYDYKTCVDIVLSNGTDSYVTTIDPTMLRRTVMVDGDRYYYLTREGVEGSRSSEGAYIHLMDNMALSSDGRILNLEDGTVSREECSFTVYDRPNPYDEVWIDDEESGNESRLRAFGSYTEIESRGSMRTEESRLLVKDGILYSLPNQNPRYADSYILGTYQDSIYFSYLTEGGDLEDMGESIAVPEGFERRGIEHLSSDRFGDGRIVLVRYKDGSVVGFDYLTGESLGEMEGMDPIGGEENVTFIDYMKNTLSAVVSDFSIVEGSAFKESYQQAGSFSNTLQYAVSRNPELAEQLNQAVYGPAEPGEEEVREPDAVQGAEDAELAEAEGAEDAELAEAEEGGDAELAEAEGAEDAELAEAEEAGDAEKVEKEETGDAEKAEKAEDAEKAQAAGDAEKAQSARNADNAKSGGDADKAQSAGDADKAQSGGDADKAKSAGDADKAQVAGDADKAKSAEKAETSGSDKQQNAAESGTAAEDEDSRKEGAAAAQQGTAGGKNSGAVQDETASVSRKEKNVRKETIKTAYVVAFNDKKGGYEVYDTDDFLDGETMNLVSENQKAKALGEAGGKLDVNTLGMRQTENPDVKEGKLLLLITAFSVTGLVLVLYQKGRRKEHGRRK